MIKIFFRLSVSVAVFLCFSSFAQAEQGHVAVVDIQRVLIHSKAGKQARDSFEKEFKEKQRLLDEKSRRYEKMEAEITKKISTMNEETLKQKSKELEARKKELVRAKEDFSDDLRRDQEEMRRKFSRQIQNIVTELGKSEGYSVIIASSGALFVADGVDVTEKVIEMHDRKY